jgi:hypothetical protein
MNKAMLVIAATAATLTAASAFAQSTNPDSLSATGVQPLQGDAAVAAAQREGAGPGIMGPMPVPSGATTSKMSPNASSAGQYSSDTAAQAPSVDSAKKPTAKAKDKASSSSSMSSGAASGSTGAATQGAGGY